MENMKFNLPRKQANVRHTHHLANVEEVLLDEVVRPAISSSEVEGSTGSFIISDTLNFTTLLRGVRDFYKRNGGKEWHQVLSDI